MPNNPSKARDALPPKHTPSDLNRHGGRKVPSGYTLGDIAPYTTSPRAREILARSRGAKNESTLG